MVQSSEVSGYVPDPLRAAFLATLPDLPLAIALLGVSGHFRFVNHAMAEINGVPVADHIDRHVSDVLPELWETLAPLLERAVHGEAVEWELSGETPAAPGVIRHWAEQWFPVRDQAGDVLCVAVTVTEVTEQKLAEAELQRVAEARDRLIHLISHELRGPLTSVLGFAQRLARKRNLDDDVRDDLEIIYHQAIQMRDRLEVLAAMSDPEGLSSVAARVESLDIGDLVRDELSLFQSRYSHIRFACEGSASVQTDSRLVREILSNVLDNAVKYGGDGGSVEVRVARTLSGAVVEVHDHGPGIDAESHGKLFEPGFRTRDAVEGDGDGDGLGLYISNQLALHLGGRLSVLSVPGNGASFFLHLPWEPPGPGVVRGDVGTSGRSG